MAKLFNILAASVGSGLVLGASIRLGEALGGKLQTGMAEPPPNGHHPRRNPPLSPAFLSRLDRLEEKMTRPPAGLATAPAPEWQSVIDGIVARMDRQQSEVDSVRQQVAKTVRALNSVGDAANHLRGDLQNELEGALDKRLEDRLVALEARVNLRIEASHGETLDAMVSAIENRVATRIDRMEGEIAGQTAAVAELREGALQSERSVQRLLGVLERLVSTPPHTDTVSPRQGAGSSGSGVQAA